MTELQDKIRQKRRVLRDEYGGMMTVTDLGRELGIRRQQAKAWGLEHMVGFRVGKRIKYDTDEVARILVEGRGMV